MGLRDPNINGLFMHVMDEGFLPPSDPEQRIHRLSLLVISTVLKGRIHGDSLSYQPSWAPGCEATAVKDAGQIRRVRLQDRSNEVEIGSIGLSLFGPEQQPELHIVSNGSFVAVRELVVGPQIESVREEVTETVTNFFDQFS